MKIIGTGLSCLDIIHKKEEVILMNGGTCANVLSVLSQLGEQVAVLIPDYCSDEQRDFFYNTLSMLDISLIKYCETQKPIPRIIEVFDHNRNHLFYTKCPDCGRRLIDNRFITKKESEKLMPGIADYDIFFTDRVSEGIKNIALTFGHLGKKAVYEPNSGRNIKAITEMAKLVHLIKFSTDRINLVTAESILKQCVNSDLDVMIATQGERGMCFSYRLSKTRFSEWVKGPHMEFERLTDTSGAGDWLTAGFLHFWSGSGYVLEKHEIFGALEAALKLSAVCSMKEGAQGAFYDKELFGLLKRRYHMKLEKEMDHDLHYHNVDGPLTCGCCFC